MYNLINIKNENINLLNPIGIVGIYYSLTTYLKKKYYDDDYDDKKIFNDLKKNPVKFIKQIMYKCLVGYFSFRVGFYWFPINYANHFSIALFLFININMFMDN